MIELTQARSAGHPGARSPSKLKGTWLDHSPCLSHEERQALESLATRARQVRPHTDLLREGDDAGNLLVVVEGWACRYNTTREGSRQLSALLVPGDIVNPDTLSLSWQAYGTRTLTQASVVALPRDQVMMLIARHSGIARAFLHASLIESSILSRWTLCLGRLSAKRRMAHLFCELAVRLGADDENDVCFDFPLTQEVLADALGLTNVHVNRTLQALRTEGLVACAHRMVTLPDVVALRRLAGFDPRYLHVKPHSVAARR